MNPLPLISIIIPAYNAQKTLSLTISSALRQTYSNIEIIVVDDGSDISPEKIIDQFGDNRISLFRIERTNASNANVARNFGISKSKGEYVAMLDADDRWLENHLHDCLTLLQESGADGLYGSSFLTKTQSVEIDQLPVVHARELKKGESMVDYLLSMGRGAQTPTLFTTARSMKDILWDPDLIDHQDYDFVVRFYKKYKMTVKKEPTVIVSLSSGRASHYETCIRFVEDNIKNIDPFVYVRYNFNMYKRTRMQKEYKFASYFQKEATRYKEYISYLQYISICNPESRIREWVNKFKYIFYILRMKTDVNS